MFHCLAAPLNIALKWFPMFDQVHTFSSALLRFKQMLDRLATLLHKAYERAKKQPITSGISCVSRHNFSGNTVTKRSVGSLFAMFEQTWFARLTTQRSA